MNDIIINSFTACGEASLNLYTVCVSVWLIYVQTRECMALCACVYTCVSVWKFVCGFLTGNELVLKKKNAVCRSP